MSQGGAGSKSSTFYFFYFLESSAFEQQYYFGLTFSVILDLRVHDPGWARGQNLEHSTSSVLFSDLCKYLTNYLL